MEAKHKDILDKLKAAVEVRDRTLVHLARIAMEGRELGLASRTMSSYIGWTDAPFSNLLHIGYALRDGFLAEHEVVKLTLKKAYILQLVRRQGRTVTLEEALSVNAEYLRNGVRERPKHLPFVFLDNEIADIDRIMTRAVKERGMPSTRRTKAMVLYSLMQAAERATSARLAKQGVYT